MENKKNDILWENEIEANKVMTSAMFVTVGILIITWILVELDIFHMVNGVPRPSIIIGIIVLLAAAFISMKNNYAKPWVKYMLMGMLIFVYGALDAEFTYGSTILMVIPIVLSSKYFSGKYTAIVTAACVIVFFISSIIGAKNGLLDLNNVELPPGSVIEFKDSTILTDAIFNIDFDVNRHIRLVLKYNYLIKLFLSTIVASASIRVAVQGKKMVLEQQALTEQTATVGAELSLAKRVQADVLPGRFPPYPERTEFNLYATMTPAKEVGGDFYDFFLIDEDHLGLVIADVSGKGIPAAMFMMFTKNIIANCAMQGKSPAEALKAANAVVYSKNSEEMFVTVWLGILTISTGRLVAANAGNEFPMIKREGIFSLYKDVQGMPIGRFDNTTYEEYELKMSPGDCIFVYTDGVIQATSTFDEVFGTDRALEILNRNKNAAPKKLLEFVSDGISAFVNGREQLDDLTMLAMEYKGLEYGE